MDRLEVLDAGVFRMDMPYPYVSRLRQRVPVLLRSSAFAGWLRYPVKFTLR